MYIKIGDSQYSIFDFHDTGELEIISFMSLEDIEISGNIEFYSDNNTLRFIKEADTYTCTKIQLDNVIGYDIIQILYIPLNNNM